MTSAGRAGGGVSEDLSQPDSSDVSQSRTYCLSKEGCALPGWYVAASQNREESGVRTSSPSVIDPETAS
ncbi:hypothetical protein D3C85_1621240 [compost metagenome]